MSAFANDIGGDSLQHFRRRYSEVVGVHATNTQSRQGIDPSHGSAWVDFSIDSSLQGRCTLKREHPTRWEFFHRRAKLQRQMPNALNSVDNESCRVLLYIINGPHARR